MRYLYTLTLCCFFINASAQIVAPDTVCIGTPVNFSTPQEAVTYAWDFDTVSINQTISTFTTFYDGTTTLSSPSAATFNNDHGHYYIFVYNYSTQEIIKLDYGTDIYSTPVETNLGSFGLSAGDGEGLDIVKDSATGNWYGVASNYSQLLVLSFGTSLASTPTGAVTTYSDIVWGHLLKIKQYLGNWYVFLSCRNGTIVRFDFGSSLSGTATQNLIPNVGGCFTPVDFSLYEQSGKWYMLISDLAASTITLYEFGTNLLNLAPIGDSLGNPSGLLYLPRNLNLLHDCEGNLICYLGNEGGHFTKLDFGGSITNIPTATDLGVMPLPRASATPVSYNDSFFYLLVDPANNKLWKYNPFYFSNPTIINYYDSTQIHTFTAPGIYHLSLFCDQSSHSGEQVFCKDIVVIPGVGTFSSRDTNLCNSVPLALTTSDSGSHVWNTGDTSATISIPGVGIYWVNTTTGACAYKSDTIHVISVSGTGTASTRDTSVCVSPSFKLFTTDAGAHIWNNGDTTAFINVSASGQYWVTTTTRACIYKSDTINIIPFRHLFQA